MIFLSVLLPLAALDIALDMEAQVAARPTAAGYHALADKMVAAREFTKGSEAYRDAASRYAKLGDPNAAKVLNDLANRYGTTVQPYADGLAPVDKNLARLEPPNGCYLGVNIERDDGTRDPGEFDRLVGKNQAIYFQYRKYGAEFPKEFAAQLKYLQAGLQLAWEPGNLSEVQDDAFLRGFAKDIKESGIPVFLRFASEMNGDWTSYHSDPAAYVAAFKRVATVIHQDAPNAAMVWCPNEIPESTIPSYFPGDDAVDWVGVNFYSVVYNDGNRSRDARWRNPSDSLRYVYDRYSKQHPMMIGEWAATHRSVVDEVERTEFAIDKIGQLYGALPRLYPRVKAVNWLSMNTEAYAEGDRRLNDFCLLDSPDVAKAYQGAIQPDYFRSTATLDPNPPSVHMPLPMQDGTVLSGTVHLSAWARSYEEHPSIRYQVGNSRTLDGGDLTGPHSVELDTSGIPNGPITITTEVVDSSGRVAGQRVVWAVVRN